MNAAASVSITKLTFGPKFSAFMQGFPLVPIGFGNRGTIFGADESAIVGSNIEPLVDISSKSDSFKSVKDAMPAGDSERESLIHRTVVRFYMIMDEDFSDILGDSFESRLKVDSHLWAARHRHNKIEEHLRARAIMENCREECYVRDDYNLPYDLARTIFNALPLNPLGVDISKAAFVSGLLFNFSNVGGSEERAAQAFLLSAEHMSCTGDLLGSAIVADVAAKVAEEGCLESAASIRRMAARRWADTLSELNALGRESDFEAAFYRGLLNGWSGPHYEEIERLHLRSASFRANAKVPDFSRAGEERLRAAQIHMRNSGTSTAEDWAKMARYLSMAADDLARASAMESEGGVNLEDLRSLAGAARAFAPDPAIGDVAGFSDVS